MSSLRLRGTGHRRRRRVPRTGPRTHPARAPGPTTPPTKRTARARLPKRREHPRPAGTPPRVGRRAPHRPAPISGTTVRWTAADRGRFMRRLLSPGGCSRSASSSSRASARSSCSVERIRVPAGHRPHQSGPLVTVRGINRRAAACTSSTSSCARRRWPKSSSAACTPAPTSIHEHKSTRRASQRPAARPHRPAGHAARCRSQRPSRCALGDERVVLRSTGALIDDVEPGAPAVGKLEPDDVIVADGKPVRSPKAVFTAMEKRKVGKRGAFTIHRGSADVAEPIRPSRPTRGQGPSGRRRRLPGPARHPPADPGADRRGQRRRPLRRARLRARGEESSGRTFSTATIAATA